MPDFLLLLLPGLPELANVLRVSLVQLPLEGRQPPVSLVLDVGDLVRVAGHQPLDLGFEAANCLLLLTKKLSRVNNVTIERTAVVHNQS